MSYGLIITDENDKVIFKAKYPTLAEAEKFAEEWGKTEFGVLGPFEISNAG